MKKAVVFMLLCMLLGCTAAQAQETPYLGGEWTLDHKILDGKRLTLTADPGVSLFFYSNGHAAFQFNGNMLYHLWSQTDNQLRIGSLIFTYREDDMLSLIDEYDGAEYVFRRVTPDLVGTWHFSFILAENGMVLNLAENGPPSSLTLNSDGTAQMNMEGEILNDFWQQKGNRVYDSSGSFFTYEDGMLIMEDEGYRIMLVRADTVETDNKAPRPAKSVAEFDGHWVTCAIETIGVEIPASQIMMDLQIQIENGAVTFSLYHPDQNGEWALNSQQKYTATLEIGHLFIVLPDETQAELILREDGKLIFRLAAIEEDALDYILVKAN